MMTRALGWRRPTVTHAWRCQVLAGPAAGLSVLADVVAAPRSDLYRLCQVRDQGPYGSCQTQAMIQAVRAAQVKAGAVDPPWASAMGIYAMARGMEGHMDADDGAAIGSAFFVGAEWGLPPESEWPYDGALLRSRPGPAVDRAAFDSRGAIGLHYHPLTTRGEAFIEDVERALTAGMIVPFGVEVTEDFCTHQPSGIVQPPGAHDSIAGGHAMCLIGHDHERRVFRVLNSWGDGWGDPNEPPGCCLFSYDYAALAADAWCVPKVTVLS